MESPYKTDQDLRDAAFLILREALGPEDALRFVRLYRPEPGDFTEERVLLVGKPSLEEFFGVEDGEARQPAELVGGQAA